LLLGVHEDFVWLLIAVDAATGKKQNTQDDNPSRKYFFHQVDIYAGKNSETAHFRFFNTSIKKNGFQQKGPGFSVRPLFQEWNSFCLGQGISGTTPKFWQTRGRYSYTSQRLKSSRKTQLSSSSSIRRVSSKRPTSFINSADPIVEPIKESKDAHRGTTTK
jgi:hypothetical protein